VTPGENGTGPDFILPGEGAYVRIMLPSKVNSRTVSLEDAKQLTNYFEVSFKRLDSETPEYFFANASSNDEYMELRIPAGQYDILLFAGHKVDEVTEWASLLASAYKQGQNILLEEENIINLTLNLFKNDIDVPPVVHVGIDFEVNVHFDFQNPLINYSNMTMSIDCIYYPVDSDNFMDGKPVNSSYDSTSGVYTYTTSFESLTSNGTGNIRYFAPAIKPFEHNGAPLVWGVEY